MKHTLGLSVVLLTGALAAGAQPARPDAVAAKQEGAFQSLDLRQVHDARLRGLLGALERDGVPVAQGRGAWSVAHADGTALVVPLERLAAPDTLLHLLYLPQSEVYLFMQVGRGADGQPELRLWSRGRAEMRVTADEALLLPSPSTRTFRLSDEAHRSLGFGAHTSDLTGDEILACLGQIVGVVWNPTTMASLLASVACTATNVFGFVQTACNCLSMFGIGANNIYAPLGCFTGMTRLISCGIARCTPSAPAPPPGGSSCTVDSIGFNQSVTGSWASSCLATHRDGRYARFFAFDLPAGGSVRINLRSSADAYLILLRGRGTGGAVVAENDDTFLSTNSEIAMSLPPGTYTIEATTYNRAVTGSFTLSLSR